MALNDESRITAAQGAQALADAIVSTPSATPVTGDAGFTICTVGEADCNRTDLTINNPTLATAIANGYISARVKRDGPLFRPPPRSVESSIDKFSSASFEVTTTYDRSDEARDLEVERLLAVVVHVLGLVLLDEPDDERAEDGPEAGQER